MLQFEYRARTNAKEPLTAQGWAPELTPVARVSIGLWLIRRTGVDIDVMVASLQFRPKDTRSTAVSTWSSSSWRSSAADALTGRDFTSARKKRRSSPRI